MDAPTVPDLLADILTELRTARERPLLLVAREAAALVGVSRSSFFAAVSGGTLPRPYQTPGGPRWKRAELERYVERLKSRPKPRARPDDPPDPA